MASEVRFTRREARYTHHSPPEGVGVADEVRPSAVADGVLLGQVDEVRGEDETEETDVEGRYQLL